MDDLQRKRLIWQPVKCEMKVRSAALYQRERINFASKLQSVAHCWAHSSAVRINRLTGIESAHRNEGDHHPSPARAQTLALSWPRALPAHMAQPGGRAISPGKLLIRNFKK